MEYEHLRLGSPKEGDYLWLLDGARFTVSGQVSDYGESLYWLNIDFEGRVFVDEGKNDVCEIKNQYRFRNAGGGKMESLFRPEGENLLERLSSVVYQSVEYALSRNGLYLAVRDISSGKINDDDTFEGSMSGSLYVPKSII